MIVRLFNDSDNRVLADCPYDATLEPDFDVARHCLVWADEYSPGLSNAGHEILYDLWSARRHIHLGIPFEDHPIGGAYYRALWTKALASDLIWNGFRRLALSAEHRTLLEQKCAQYSNSSATL